MEDAVLNTIANGPTTRDLVGSASTIEFTEAIIESINQNESIKKLIGCNLFGF